ncbi:hypothetical protein KCV06_g421, partial [Aureobasidium melanogenum]
MPSINPSLINRLLSVSCLTEPLFLCDLTATTNIESCLATSRLMHESRSHFDSSISERQLRRISTQVAVFQPLPELNNADDSHVALALKVDHPLRTAFNVRNPTSAELKANPKPLKPRLALNSAAEFERFESTSTSIEPYLCWRSMVSYLTQSLRFNIAIKCRRLSLKFGRRSCNDDLTRSGGPATCNLQPAIVQLHTSLSTWFPGSSRPRMNHKDSRVVNDSQHHYRSSARDRQLYKSFIPSAFEQLNLEVYFETRTLLLQARSSLNEAGTVLWLVRHRPSTSNGVLVHAEHDENDSVAKHSYGCMAALKYWSLNSEDVNDSRNKRNFQALMSQHGPLYYSTTIACAHAIHTIYGSSIMPRKAQISDQVRTIESCKDNMPNFIRRALSIAPSDSPPGGTFMYGLLWLKAVPAGPSRRSIHDQTRRKENQR